MNGPEGDVVDHFTAAWPLHTYHADHAGCGAPVMEIHWRAPLNSLVSDNRNSVLWPGGVSLGRASPQQGCQITAIPFCGPAGNLSISAHARRWVSDNRNSVLWPGLKNALRNDQILMCQITAIPFCGPAQSWPKCWL